MAGEKSSAFGFTYLQLKVICSGHNQILSYLHHLRKKIEP